MHPGTYVHPQTTIDIFTWNSATRHSIIHTYKLLATINQKAFN